jgi:hypothetical protein
VRREVLALVVAATVGIVACSSNHGAKAKAIPQSNPSFCAEARAFAAKYAGGVDKPADVPKLVADLKTLVRHAPPEVVADLQVIEDAVANYSTGASTPPADESAKVEAANSDLAKFSREHCGSTTTTTR